MVLKLEGCQRDVYLAVDQSFFSRLIFLLLQTTVEEDKTRASYFLVAVDLEK
jgi:hypothetical protein